jgi:hypothetical protein
MTKRKEFQALATMIVALAIVTRVARRFFGVAGLEVLDGLLILLCTIGFLVIVLWQVYREGPVTAHRIQGAVAGYLLLSVIFAIAYSLAETIQPGSFQMSSVQDQVRAELVMDQSLLFQCRHPDHHGIRRHPRPEQLCADPGHDGGPHRPALHGDPDRPFGVPARGDEKGKKGRASMTPCGVDSRRSILELFRQEAGHAFGEGAAGG